MSSTSAEHSKSSYDDSDRRRRWLLAGYLIVTVFLSAIAIGAWVYIPRFVPVFKPLGSNLPWLTSLIVASAMYWAVLPATTTIIACDIWRRVRLTQGYEAALRRVLFVFAMFAVAIIPVSVWALYLPMFKLGDA